jgi:hypothetical protein
VQRAQTYAVSGIGCSHISQVVAVLVISMVPLVA